MSISRREFGLVLSAGLFGLLSGEAQALQNLPLGLGLDANDDVKRRKAHVDGGVHHKRSSKATSITDVWQPIKFKEWAGVQGAAAIEVDHDGRWTFSGRFYDSSAQSDRVALVMGITNDSPTGTLFLFETSGVMTVSQGGKRQYTWYKQGRSYDVEGDWKRLQAGHFWAGHVAYRGPEATGPVLGFGGMGGGIGGMGGGIGGMGGGIGGIVSGQQSSAPGQIDFAGLENAVETRLKSVGKVVRLCR